MTNTGRRAVVADNSSSSGSTKTTITANRINLHANGSYAIVNTKANSAFTGGQIEINGLDKTIIINEKEGGTAVSAEATPENALGLIEINQKTLGIVEITGKIRASNGTVNVNFAGNQSFLKGDMNASGANGKILTEFKGADSTMTGDMNSYNTATINTTFSGKNTNFTGNINAVKKFYQSGSYVGNQSTVVAVFSGQGASMTGDITAAGDSTITSIFSGNETSFTGNIDTTLITETGSWSKPVDSPNNSTVIADFSGNNSTFKGNLTSAGTSKANVSITNKGLWIGKSQTIDDALTSITLSNSSHWKLTGNSNVSSLDLSSGSIVSLAGNAHSLDIGMLKASSTPGIFVMDLSYHDNNISTYETAEDSDFLYAHNGSGSTFTVHPTTITSVASMKPGDKLYFAQVKQGAAAFAMNKNIRLQNKTGLFDNVLSVTKEADTIKTGYEDWFLTPISDGKLPNPNALTPESAHNSAFAMWRDTDTLLKRLRELRYNQKDNGLWARFINKKLQWDEKNGFESTHRTIQIGLDNKKSGKNDDWYYGIAIKHTWGNSDYESYGNGKQRLTDIALYATKLGTKGHYLDLTTKFGYLSSDYRTIYGDKGEFDNWAFNTGVEYGRKKALGKDWFLEPQAQLTNYFLKGGDYTTENGISISQNNADSLVGRLGVILSKEYGMNTRNPKRVYIKASMQHDFLGNRSENLYQNNLSFYDNSDFGDT